MMANRRLNRIILDTGIPVPIALPDNFGVFSSSGSMELVFTTTETTSKITWEQIDGTVVTYTTSSTNVTKIEFTTSDLLKKKWRVYTNKGRAYERQAEGWFVHYPVDYVLPLTANSTVLDYPGINLNYNFVEGLFTSTEVVSLGIGSPNATNNTGLLNNALNDLTSVKSVVSTEVYKLIGGTWVLSYTLPYYTHQLPVQDNVDHKIVIISIDQGRYVEVSQIILVSSHWKNYSIDTVNISKANSTNISGYTVSLSTIGSTSVSQSVSTSKANSTNLLNHNVTLQNLNATSVNEDIVQTSVSNSTEMSNYTVQLQTSTGVI